MSKSLNTKYKKLVTILGILCVVAFLSACNVKPAWVPDYKVTSTIDAPDANPGDRLCETESGECTLRAAIQEANASSPSDDNEPPEPPSGAVMSQTARSQAEQMAEKESVDPETIFLPVGEYVLDIDGTREDDSATGDLDILGGDGDVLVIEGQGSDSTIVSAEGLDRVFDVHTGTDVRISEIGITGGDAGFDAGGGIRNRGSLNLVESEVSGNLAEFGGGIDNASGGNLTIKGSTVKSNEATDGRGGGVYNAGGRNDAVLTVETTGTPFARRCAALPPERGYGR